MLDGILNNRKEWNAKKEEYEAKLKALEEEKAAKEAATASKGAVILWNNHMYQIICPIICATACYFVTLWRKYQLSHDAKNTDSLFNVSLSTSSCKQPQWRRLRLQDLLSVLKGQKAMHTMGVHTDGSWPSDFTGPVSQSHRQGKKCNKVRKTATWVNAQPRSISSEKLVQIRKHLHKERILTKKSSDLSLSQIMNVKQGKTATSWKNNTISTSCYI